MINYDNSTQTEKLEFSRVSLNNARTNPEISALLAARGCDTEMLNQGQQLLINAFNAYNDCSDKKHNRKAIYENLMKKLAALEALYSGHRQLARSLFADDPVTADKLGLLKTLPKKYIDRLGIMKTFYTDASAANIQEILARFNITGDDIQNALALITEIENLKALHVNEKGEVQVASKAKRKALKELDKWMRQFFIVAKVAFREEPQYMEALGKVVKE